MSLFREKNADFTVREESYLITYKLVESINPYFEDYELLEYGIECYLYNQDEEVVTCSEVAHISPNRTYVIGLLHKIASNKVFPVHLQDVVEDLMMDESLVAS